MTNNHKKIHFNTKDFYILFTAIFVALLLTIALTFYSHELSTEQYDDTNEPDSQTVEYIADSSITLESSGRIAVRVSKPVNNPRFEIVDSNNKTIDVLQLNDNADGPDRTANDNVYTGYYTPTTEGEFRVKMTSPSIETTIVSSNENVIKIQPLSLSLKSPKFIDALPGERVMHEYELSNMGSAELSYNLVVTAPKGWLIDNYQKSIILSPGQVITVPVSTQVPKDFPPGALAKLSLEVIDPTTSESIAQEFGYISYNAH